MQMHVFIPDWFNTTDRYFFDPALPAQCPQCDTGPDPLYGWDPLLRWALFDLGVAPVVIVKEQCWQCGHHRAYQQGLPELKGCNAEKPEA